MAIRGNWKREALIEFKEEEHSAPVRMRVDVPQWCVACHIFPTLPILSVSFSLLFTISDTDDNLKQAERRPPCLPCANRIAINSQRRGRSPTLSTTVAAGRAASCCTSPSRTSATTHARRARRPQSCLSSRPRQQRRTPVSHPGMKPKSTSQRPCPHHRPHPLQRGSHPPRFTRSRVGTASRCHPHHRLPSFLFLCTSRRTGGTRRRRGSYCTSCPTSA